MVANNRGILYSMSNNYLWSYFLFLLQCNLACAASHIINSPTRELKKRLKKYQKGGLKGGLKGGPFNLLTSAFFN